MGVSQSLIWVGNKWNLLFREEATSVELPTPNLVTSMFIDEGEALFLSGCDIYQYYKRFRSPADQVPLLGLPRIEAKLIAITSPSGYVTPLLTCIYMGTTFAVAWNRE